MNVFVSRDGQELGEYSQQAFNQLLEKGAFHPSDFFWVEGMEDWKPLSLAKSYFGHREKCHLCGGKMTEQKPVTTGHRVGQTRSVCLKCGHTEHHRQG